MQSNLFTYGFDNNCNGLTDNEDDACNAEVSLTVTNGNNLF